MLKYSKLLIFLLNVSLYGVYSTLDIIGLKSHMFLVLIAFELLLVSVGVLFAIVSVYLNEVTGAFFSIVLFTVGAAESALGLTILVLFYKLNGSVSTDYVYKLGEYNSFILLKG